jgi:hypothetical protein
MANNNFDSQKLNNNQDQYNSNKGENNSLNNIISR